MKFCVITFLLCLTFSITNAQSDEEIGSVYIKRAEQSYLDNEMKKAREYFDKAISYINEINDSRVARIGTLLSYDIKDYTKAKILARRYFELVRDKEDEENKNIVEYEEMLDLYVTIDEALKQRAKEEEQRRKERIRLAKEQRKLDSLTNAWVAESQKFFLSIDSIGKFNKNKIAVYKLGNKLGLIDDYGNILLKAENYSNVIKNEDYILFTNNSKRPTLIHCYNTSTKDSYQLPNVSEANPKAYDFGTLMLPRNNGKLVTYPSNLADVVVYDLKTRKFEEKLLEDEKKDLLKILKKNDIIDKYDRDLNIKIEKEFYKMGPTLGGGFYPLFNMNNSLHGFLNTSNGRVFTSDYYGYFGAFCDGEFQVIENGKNLLMDTEGLKKEFKQTNKNFYGGSAKIAKSSDGKYQIIHKVNGKEIIVLGNNTLKMLEDYIDEHSR